MAALFGAFFTAKSSDVLRRNAVIMPFYRLILPFVFFAGFAAIMIVPGLSNGDLSLLTLVRPLGLIGGSGGLTAMVPAAILILTAATLFAKNFYRPLFVPKMTDDDVARVARIMVGIVTGSALCFAIYSSNTTLVGLLLLGYVAWHS